MERLKGKTAMVVGAGSIGPGWGNGKATAVTFAREGAQVFCVDRNAAAALRSTQNTCAPSRAKVTAVALPLPQPGPIEPAPTTIAVLPLSRSIDFFSLCVLVLL